MYVSPQLVVVVVVDVDVVIVVIVSAKLFRLVKKIRVVFPIVALMWFFSKFEMLNFALVVRLFWVIAQQSNSF